MAITDCELVPSRTAPDKKRKAASTTNVLPKRTKIGALQAASPEDVIEGADEDRQPHGGTTMAKAREVFVKADGVVSKKAHREAKTATKKFTSMDGESDTASKIKKAKTTDDSRGKDETVKGNIESKKATNRKLKSTKPAEPLAERTTDTRLRVGAHVSAAGGKSLLQAMAIWIQTNMVSIMDD